MEQADPEAGGRHRGQPLPSRDPRHFRLDGPRPRYSGAHPHASRPGGNAQPEPGAPGGPQPRWRAGGSHRPPLQSGRQGDAPAQQLSQRGLQRGHRHLDSIDIENERAEVDYDGRKVSYGFMELDELGLAYAISVHKSQGSEYPAVVIPLLTQHYIMLQRNLLYTALSRGKQLVVIVGTAKALNVALKNDRPRQRRSMLARRLNPEIDATQS
jgi:hypothetical protein